MREHWSQRKSNEFSKFTFKVWVSHRLKSEIEICWSSGLLLVAASGCQGLSWLYVSPGRRAASQPPVSSGHFFHLQPVRTLSFSLSRAINISIISSKVAQTKNKPFFTSCVWVLSQPPINRVFSLMSDCRLLLQLRSHAGPAQGWQLRQSVSLPSSPPHPSSLPLPREWVGSPGD